MYCSSHEALDLSQECVHTVTLPTMPIFGHGQGSYWTSLKLDAHPPMKHRDTLGMLR